MTTHYLDNSATTKPHKEVADKIYSMLTEHYGNPSSFHSPGLEANAQMRTARQSIADLLSCESDEIYFTSGGTEANNLALMGAAAANARKGKRIVTTAIEHESVFAACGELEKKGFEVIRLMPDKKGKISEEQIFNTVNSNTILVSIMLVNNEVGSILPVAAAAKAIKRVGAPALLHTDCVQAFGKIQVKPSKLGADLCTITAHKIHGPKGVGALYIKKGVRIVPRTFGGEQEKRIRPGTEAVPLIAGFGTAAAMAVDISAKHKKVSALNEYTKKALLEIDGLAFNSPDDASPYILNFCVPTFMTSQTVVQHLSGKYGVYVSSGSACAKGKKSHVLTAMKLPDSTVQRSIRVSFSAKNTKEDADVLITAIKETTSDYPLK